MSLNNRLIYRESNCYKHLKDIGKIISIRHKSEPYNITLIGKNGKINCYDKDFIQLLLKTKFNEVIGIDEPKLKELITHLPLNRKIIFNYKAKIIKIYKNVRINL